jgi:hypothetical protein
MEIIGITTTIVFVSIVWFFIVLSVSKALNIKKDAPISKIMCCLVLMGPIGWSIILVITAYDLVDRLFTSKK